MDYDRPLFDEFFCFCTVKHLVPLFSSLTSCMEIFTSLNLYIGTHNVQSVSANNCSMPGVVNISCTFAEKSTSMGYLSILLPQLKANSSNGMFVVANRSDVVNADLDISVPGVPPGDYVVIVFDLESSGLPVLSTSINPYTLSAGEEENITVINQGDEGNRVNLVVSL